ncbi:MAG: hypothetical protein HKO80_10250 [Flavobacteriaceae bacterium]|nr:hypothetical protein [Flavobacteriaceae bacterium]
MCTVSFFPINNGDFILTTNRDEAPNRLSLAPDFYEIKNVRTLFPKDKNAGGTWIGASEKNRVLCILNGGFSFHKRKDKYRISRGLIVKELLVCEDLNPTIDSMDFEGVEPFTLILIDWNTELICYELVWTGQKKHLTLVDNKPGIWSSSSLYNHEMKTERHKWFESFINTSELTSSTILNFHKSTGKGNDEYGFIMDRGFVKTTSITQIIKSKNKLTMYFNDFINKKEVTKILKPLSMINE